MHDGADRHVANRHGIAGLHVDMLAGHDGVALAEPLRRQDIGEFAILIFDECDEPGAVRIVFDPLDARRLVVLEALEIDRAQRPLVAAAAEAHRNAPVVVAPARRNLAGRERLDGLALIERGTVDQDKLALARCRRFIVLECHGSCFPRLRALWSRRCGDLPRASRWPSSRPTKCRAYRGNCEPCPCGSTY